MDESQRALLNENGFAKVGDDTLSLDDWTEKLLLDDCAFLRSRDHEFDLNDDPLLVNRRLYVRIRVESGLITSNLKGGY